MLRFVGPSLVKRFTHTHSKTIFPENNNKVIEDLIRQQNKILQEISKQISVVIISIGLINLVIFLKPIR